MEERNTFTLDEAKDAASQAGIDFTQVDFTPEQLMVGMNVELEHGSRDPETNVSNDDPVVTAKIAWAHLKESKDYYEYLEEMEKQMES